MIKLLQPDMPTADELLPFLRRIDASKVYVNNGPLLGELEAALARAAGAECVAVSNATVALELVLRANFAGWMGPAPVVLVPSVTYSASGQAIKNAGCEPFITDVDPLTWQLTPPIAYEWLRQHPNGIDAVMPVAAFGSPVPVDEWAAFYLDTGVPVVIDAAGALTEQAAPATGMAIVYSMHATKFWGAGEGGVVCSNSELLLSAVRSLACFGPGGTNAKMSEYHAAVGLASMTRLPGKHLRTMAVFDAYARALPEALLHAQQAGPLRGNWTLLNVRIPAEVCSANEAIKFLKSRGIEAKSWYAPYLHQRTEFMPYWKGLEFPVAEALSDSLVGIPFHTGLTDHDVVRVCVALIDLLR